MNFRWADNTKRLSGAWKQCKAVSKEDIHTKPTLHGCDVMKAGTAARPRGGHPEGVRNATKSPQIEHSRERQQTLIATTLCANLNYLATNSSLV